MALPDDDGAKKLAINPKCKDCGYDMTEDAELAALLRPMASAMDPSGHEDIIYCPACRAKNDVEVLEAALKKVGIVFGRFALDGKGGKMRK